MSVKSRAGLLFTAIVATMLPSVAAAQTWRDAYSRGEYERASAMLHDALVASLSSKRPAPDPYVLEALSHVYLHGRGVDRDPLLACSFVSLAVVEAGSNFSTPDHPEVTRLLELERSVCGQLSAEDREFAAQLIGCPKFSVPSQSFPLDGNRSVELDGVRIRVLDGDRHKNELLTVTCFERAAIARHTVVDPPPDANPRVAPRHLIELFSWTPGAPFAERQRILVWKVVEIAGRNVQTLEVQEVMTDRGWLWGPMPVPPELTRVHFDMTGGGDIVWRFSSTALTGVIPALPIEVAPDTPDDLPPLPTTGTARVHVTVLDASQAPLAGATVKLTGVVAREATADDMGVVAFGSLPAGRYDVTADQNGLGGGPPRVIDVSTGAGVGVVFRLKPRGALLSGDICGGPPAGRSIEELADRSDVVVHVKIEDDRSYDGEPFTPIETMGPIVTASEARALRRFKARTSAGNSALRVVQYGGWLDRGSRVDHYDFNNFVPLNVGDEYVLFLTASDNGALRIHGAQEGVFRVRNGRVEPFGNNDVARAWKGRSAAKFFEALETRIRR